MFKRKNLETHVCGLHIGGNTVRMAMLTTDTAGVRSLKLDSVDVSIGARYLESMEAALVELTSRNGLKRFPITVILDGDYCVTRVSTGTAKEVDQDQKRLSTRVPRYLSLGPGEKVTGGYRYSINNKSEYAVTGVANRRVIEALQQIIRKCGLSPTSIEPSMVAVARAIHASLGVEAPLLLSDGSGTQWDVAIVQNGRVLLDYRPSAARESDRFGEILCGHMSRLHRFCQRHRHLGHDELHDIYVHGPEEKAGVTARTIAAMSDMTVHVLTADKLISNCALPEEASSSSWVGAVAAALTTETVTEKLQVADLLSSVRTVGQKSFGHHLFWTITPVFAATVTLAIMYGVVEQQRHMKEDVAYESATVTAELVELRSAAEDLRTYSSKLSVFETVERRTQQHEFANLLIDQIPKCLPDATKLSRVQLSIDGTIRITGTALDESIVFDVTSGLRRLPGVADVQLEGTNPSGEIGDSVVAFALIIRMNEILPDDEVQDEA